MRPKSPIFSNPQALASVSTRTAFTGDPSLLAHNGVDRDTWLTPRYILDSLGPFDLDPCAAIAAPQWVAPAYYTRETDGLRSEWFGRVFVNPPFSDTVPWVVKAAAFGRGLMLIPASVESRHWRAHIWPRAKAVLLLHSRTRFANPDGSMTNGRPLRSIALIAWAADDVERLRGCALAGVLLDSWHQR